MLELKRNIEFTKSEHLSDLTHTQEIIMVLIFLAQKITTKTDLRCFDKLGPDQ